ncbi:hypothetical protein FKM82_019304 [Ascaphus truei]
MFRSEHGCLQAGVQQISDLNSSTAIAFPFPGEICNSYTLHSAQDTEISVDRFWKIESGNLYDKNMIRNYTMLNTLLHWIYV